MQILFGAAGCVPLQARLKPAAEENVLNGATRLVGRTEADEDVFLLPSLAVEVSQLRNDAEGRAESMGCGKKEVPEPRHPPESRAAPPPERSALRVWKTPT